MPYGLQAMLKEGYTHVSGMTEAVYKNLEACKELSKIAATSMGPNGEPMRLGNDIHCLVAQCQTTFDQHGSAGSAQLHMYFLCAGMNKIVINHLDKTFVTSDATVMINELEVQHPAAKLVVFAAKSQETEIGDGTNMVCRRL